MFAYIYTCMLYVYVCAQQHLSRRCRIVVIVVALYCTPYSICLVCSYPYLYLTSTRCATTATIICQIKTLTSAPSVLQRRQGAGQVQRQSRRQTVIIIINRRHGSHLHPAKPGKPDSLHVLLLLLMLMLWRLLLSLKWPP